LLLLLSGPPGSGKSTFCEELLRCCGVAGDPVLTGWTVVCQDTAGASGIKPGKREKVEAAAKAGLARGQSVVVDRTNLDATQRAHFTAIGRGLAVPVHVLVFSTPHAK
ncbi:AAA domain-containing protein, partial [Pavlovales sp. CCMP2436]